MARLEDTGSCFLMNLHLSLTHLHPLRAHGLRGEDGRPQWVGGRVEGRGGLCTNLTRCKKSRETEDLTGSVQMQGGLRGESEFQPTDGAIKHGQPGPGVLQMTAITFKFKQRCTTRHARSDHDARGGGQLLCNATSVIDIFLFFKSTDKSVQCVQVQISPCKQLEKPTANVLPLCRIMLDVTKPNCDEQQPPSSSSSLLLSVYEG